MNKLLLLFFLSASVFSQTKPLLTGIKIDKNTRLIGMYPQYDKSKTYQSLNFYIEDVAILEYLSKELTYNEPGKNVIEHNDFSIKVIQDHNYVTQWSISPKYSTIRVEGVSYKINMNLIRDLAKRFPFDYEVFEDGFETQKKYDAYLNNIKKDEKFLFAFEPDFQHEGTFEIEFPKNDTFPHPKAIDDHLRPKIEKIAGADNFSISYVLDSYNMQYRNQFTMTVEVSKDIYNRLMLEGLRQKNWKYNKPSAMFFKRKI